MLNVYGVVNLCLVSFDQNEKVFEERIISSGDVKKFNFFQIFLWDIFQKYLLFVQQRREN